ncbi:hypothetical protein EJ03DRAFT_330645 [Teratosphaeria nubilosa]|uniref:MARVEL domain-containing protein n=1 Tax=Teratosphaeria nubilosa TaxID=161662 RepID=A0A6G1KYV0_9PEZI|nr:hypothetical protein EJ03DRAFT_330645 [Teratosphaeria nubilosa]
MGLWQVVNMAMRGLAFLWALLIMALCGNIIARNTTSSIINYDLFVSIWGMLTLLYLLPASIKESFSIHPVLPLVLDVLNVIFWFCGAVATAAELHVHSCSNSAYVNSNRVTRVSSETCREAQASTAFLWFGFASFAFSLIVSGLGMGGSSAPRGGVRRGPAMSQV